MTTADKMRFFQENADARKAAAIENNSFYGENIPQAQTGIPWGMRSVGSPAFAREQKQMGRSDKQFAKGHHLRDKANLYKPGKAPSPYVNEKKAARIDKRSDRAFNKSRKIQDKYL
jgi:hypothetical protein